MKQSRTSAKRYLSLWLAEQISIDEWLKLLRDNPDIEEVYNEHIVKQNVGDN